MASRYPEDFDPEEEMELEGKSDDEDFVLPSQKANEGEY